MGPGASSSGSAQPAASLQDELVKLCDDWSDFRNFFCPCKMLVSKEKRTDGKGYTCKYDKPRTPYQRVLDEHVLTPHRQQPAHKPRRGTKIECPVFGKPKTTKLLIECLFYLTNWERQSQLRAEADHA